MGFVIAQSVRNTFLIPSLVDAIGGLQSYDMLLQNLQSQNNC